MVFDHEYFRSSSRESSRLGEIMCQKLHGWNYRFFCLGCGVFGGFDMFGSLGIICMVTFLDWELLLPVIFWQFMGNDLAHFGNKFFLFRGLFYE